MFSSSDDKFLQCSAGRDRAWHGQCRAGQDGAGQGWTGRQGGAGSARSVNGQGESGVPGSLQAQEQPRFDGYTTWYNQCTVYSEPLSEINYNKFVS